AGAGRGFAMSGNADEFIAKWQARWPEWGIGAAFVPAAARDTAFAWFALLQELTDAAWGGADATPGLAKLAWWNEELRGWAKGGRRHPLGEVLQARAAPWEALAAALLPLQASRGLPPSDDPAQAGMGAIALAVAECEEALSGTGADAGTAARARACDLLAERRLSWGEAGDAGQLPAPAQGKGTRPGRVQSAFIRERLRRAMTGQQLATPPLRSLWLAWRAARGA